MSTNNNKAPGVRLLNYWQILSPLPLGMWLFSRILILMVPYSGSLGAKVRELKPGYAQISLQDRRKVRNHLNSVHAIALVNLGELVSGLAMLTALPDGVRGIVTNINVSYQKKARGDLLAECRCEPPEVTGDVEHFVLTEIKDADGDTVATVVVTWRLGLMP